MRVAPLRLPQWRMSCRIVFVLFPGFQQLDLAGPMAVFEVARLERPDSYSWRLAANTAGVNAAATVASSAGVAWPVQPLPRRCGHDDLVMVIGGDGVDAACRDTHLIRWLRRASESGARIASICSGSLLLAAAGLLDQRTATTHWSRGRQFAEEFPAVRLQPDRIYVREPAVASGSRRLPELWTSAGMTAGIDLCLALVAHDCGEAVAREAASHLRPGTAFLDLNSASPGAKREAAGLIEAAGGHYVEAGVMTSVPPYGIRVPMLLGGPHAEVLAQRLRAFGMDASAVSPELGVASAIKMCRSVMIKGLEALVIESYTAARAYGVEDYVLPTLQETFPSIDWQAQGAYFFSRVVQHGKRRAEEMREAANTVQEAGFAPLMTAAIAGKQQWVADQAAVGQRGVPG